MDTKKTTTTTRKCWLARSKLMGYEIFSEKPELRNESGDIQWRMLAGFTTGEIGKRGLYICLGNLHLPTSSPLCIANEKVKRITLELIMSTRKRKSVTVGATLPSEDKTTVIRKMTKHSS